MTRVIVYSTEQRDLHAEADIKRTRAILRKLARKQRQEIAAIVSRSQPQRVAS